MPIDNREYYEKFDWEEAKLNKKLNGKIKKIIQIIPKEVKTIIDIGCGDGTISNALIKNYHVISLDRSKNALKYLKAKSLCASADNLPIKENSFDLVFSSEMIEHLPNEIFLKSISEFKRVAKKYILLTFPNNENIEKNFVECPNCKFRFNKVYHLRSLNANKIMNLFSEYEIVFMDEWGLKVRHYNKILSKIKHLTVPAKSWIPNYWTKNITRKTTCPDCNYSFNIPYKFNILGFLLDLLNILISRKRKYQLFVLLKKKKFLDD